MKRLSGWDAVLLYSETPTVHMHTLKLAVIELDDARGPAVRHRRVPQGDPRPALQARAVPLRARRHPVQVPPSDVAGELRGRPRLPRPARTGSTARVAGVSSTRRSARSPARRWTAAGRCGRCTSSKASPTAGSPCLARSTTRWPTVSRRPTCWRAAWTCRRVRRPTGTRTQPIRRPTQGRTGAHGVRRPPAADRVGCRARCATPRRASAGFGRAHASCRPS